MKYQQQIGVLMALFMPYVLTSFGTSGTQYTDSLQDCKNLFDNFDVTMRKHYLNDPVFQNKAKPYAPAGQIDDDENTNYYELVTCNYPGICPDSNDAKSFCSWLRVFIVDCQEANGKTYYDIYNNGMPNHCYRSNPDSPAGTTVVSEIQTYAFVAQAFNVQPREMFALSNKPANQLIYSVFDTQTAVNNHRCQTGWAKNEEIDQNIRENYAELKVQFPVDQGDVIAWDDQEVNQSAFPLVKLLSSDDVVGVALNGVLIFSGTTHLGYDVFFPQAYGSKADPQGYSFDICLGTQVTSRTYRYHSYSPCVYDIALRKTSMLCQRHDSCKKNVTQHALENTPTLAKGIQPIGIAKDGRIIYGPYKTGEELWGPCDVDICNGRKFGDNYGYVATMFHPYTVACWGPGNEIGFVAQCSSNTKKCATFANSALFNYSVSLFGLIAAMFYQLL